MVTDSVTSLAEKSAITFSKTIDTASNLKSIPSEAVKIVTGA